MIAGSKPHRRRKSAPDDIYVCRNGKCGVCRGTFIATTEAGRFE